MLPSIYVSAIAVAQRGAWPFAFADLYPMDDAAISRYMTLARSSESTLGNGTEGVAQFLAEWEGGVQAAA